MSHSITIISNTNHSKITEYLQNNIVPTILGAYPDIAVQIVDENHTIYTSYCIDTSRFPIFIIFKNNIKKTVSLNKFSEAGILDWLKKEISVT